MSNFESIQPISTNEGATTVKKHTYEEKMAERKIRAELIIEKGIANGTFEESDRKQLMLSMFPTPEYRKELLELVKKSRR